MKKIIVLFLTLFTCISTGLGQGLYDIPVGGVLKGITTQLIVDKLDGEIVEFSEESTSIYTENLYGHPCIISIVDPERIGFVESTNLVFTSRKPQRVGSGLRAFGTTLEKAEEIMQDIIRELVSNYEDPQSSLTEEDLLSTFSVEKLEDTWNKPVIQNGVYYYKVLVIKAGLEPKNVAKIALINEKDSDFENRTVLSGWTVFVALESGIGQALYNYNNN